MTDTVSTPHEARLKGQFTHERRFETVSPADLSLLTDFAERTLGTREINQLLLSRLCLDRAQGGNAILRSDSLSLGDNQHRAGGQGQGRSP